MFTQILLAASIAASPVSPIAADDQASGISLEDRGLLRCAAAFAIIARAQEGGDEAARKWPEVGERGREFFVRALAQVMENTGLDREGISRAAGVAAQKIQESGELDKIMPACLVMLEASDV